MLLMSESKSVSKCVTLITLRGNVLLALCQQLHLCLNNPNLHSDFCVKMV